MVAFGQSGCIRGKMLHFDKVVVFGKCGCIWAKVVVFGQNDCIGAKVVVFRQVSCIRAKWLYSGKSG